MDTNINLHTVTSGFAKSATGVVNQSLNTAQFKAASSHSQTGKALPQGVNVGVGLPQSAEKPSSPTLTADPNSQDKLSRLAAALVTELGSSPNIERTEQAVAKLNEILKDRERDLEFSVDEDTGRTILKVIHAESGEVIRQIPPEELLNIARVFIEGTGSLIDDQA